MGIPKPLFCYCTLFILLSIHPHHVFSYTYQVGDLNAWGIPPSPKPQLYTNWPKSHNFSIGDTLFFLYPPTQDSVIQVTKDSFASCNLKDPILYMDDGNSLFNFTRPGDFYFTSGVDGHCGKSQKLHIWVSGDGSFVEPPADGPAASAPSYPTNFGSIPMQQASGNSSAASAALPAVVASAAAGILWLSLVGM